MADFQHIPRLGLEGLLHRKSVTHIGVTVETDVQQKSQVGAPIHQCDKRVPPRQQDGTGKQAGIRTHAENRSKDLWTHQSLNLQHTAAAAESFFHHEGRWLDGAEALRRRARRGIAQRAYWSAVSHAMRANPEAFRLLGLAFRLSPATIFLPPLGYLLRRRESHPATFDPTGEFNLGLAKKVRRLALRERTVDRPGVLQAMADDFFPLPRVELTYWTRSTITSKAG